MGDNIDSYFDRSQPLRDEERRFERRRLGRRRSDLAGVAAGCIRQDLMLQAAHVVQIRTLLAVGVGCQVLPHDRIGWGAVIGILEVSEGPAGAVRCRFVSSDFQSASRSFIVAPSRLGSDMGKGWVSRLIATHPWHRRGPACGSAHVAIGTSPRQRQPRRVGKFLDSGDISLWSDAGSSILELLRRKFFGRQQGNARKRKKCRNAGFQTRRCPAEPKNKPSRPDTEPA